MILIAIFATEVSQLRIYTNKYLLSNRIFTFQLNELSVEFAMSFAMYCFIQSSLSSQRTMQIQDNC